jgi:tRNA (uracil-5-)-methyltransferase TRM9
MVVNPAEETSPGTESLIPHSNLSAEGYEAIHVHDIYEQIADHFASTRYKVGTLVLAPSEFSGPEEKLTDNSPWKPWPIIKKFLESIPAGSVGLDVGCGNGKNMTVNHDIFIIGTDRSESLAKIAAGKTAHNSAAVADILNLPHPASRFEFAICIAVVHHLSTNERRVGAIRSVLELLTPAASSSERRRHGHHGSSAGTALFHVWALEQKNSRRGWDENHHQDVMVPWVTKKSKADDGGDDRVVQRYYHLYRKGELEQDIQQAGGRVLDSGYEKDNWWAIATREQLP